MSSINNKTMDMLRKRTISPTSRNDILYMFDNKVKIIPFGDLDKYDSLDELLEPYMSVIILYPNPPPNDDIGHWCCIMVNNDGKDKLRFFDSYGCYIDSKIADYDSQVRESHKIEPKLLELIMGSKYYDKDSVYYNDKILQGEILIVKDPNPYNGQLISTCGLWCTLRLKNKHMGDDEFYRQFYELPLMLGINPDINLSNMICNLFPEMMKV